MPRVLMITARYAPDARIGTRRVLRLCRRLPARGWTPVVLHPDAQAANPTPPPIDDSLRAPPIEAHSVPAFFPSVRLQRLAEAPFGRFCRAPAPKSMSCITNVILVLAAFTRSR